jgi:hypothetical protein
VLRNHLDVVVSVNSYNPTAAGVAADLRGPIGPMAPVLERLDPLLANPIYLTDEEFRQREEAEQFRLIPWGSQTLSVPNTECATGDRAPAKLKEGEQYEEN